MGNSILDDLGQELTGIISPVSICMALTVALVRILNPDGASDAGAVYFASAYYNEQVRMILPAGLVSTAAAPMSHPPLCCNLQEGDSAGKKLSGSIINALIFIGVVTVMTFILVLLFKYGVRS
jgi:presenilin 1